jgi:hypothetical protein
MEWVTPRTLTLPWGSENVRVANDDPDPEVVADCDFVVEYVLVPVRVLLRGEEIESVVVGVIVDTYVSRLCVDEEDRLRRSVAVIAARLMEGVRPWTLTLPRGSDNVRVANDELEAVAVWVFIVEYVSVTVRVSLQGEETESVIVVIVPEWFEKRLQTQPYTVVDWRISFQAHVDPSLSRVRIYSVLRLFGSPLANALNKPFIGWVLPVLFFTPS